MAGHNRPFEGQGGSPSSKLVWGGVLAVAAILLVIWGLVQPAADANALQLPYSVFWEQLDNANVTQVTIRGTTLHGNLKKELTYPAASAATSTDVAAALSRTGTSFVSQIPDFGDPRLLPALQAHQVTTGVEASGQPAWLGVVLGLAPWLVLAGLFVFLSRRPVQGQDSLFRFAQSRAKRYSGAGQRVTFADVAGIDEAKADLQDVIDFLRRPSRYEQLGGRIPRGVLLVGPAGTGKTLLAKAAAGEANVPFFSISGSEFVEILVGVGASRVRSLFAQAKATPSPSIIFVDEIDAVGRRRGLSMAGSNEEREQTLNQILVEMDGFEPNNRVVVLAATNRPDVLDPALLRPGRFDRQVRVDPPERAGREAILRVHARRLRLAGDVYLDQIARATPGMVGADLSNLVNEAALLAARRDLQAVDQQCLLDALEKIQLGAERSLVLGDEERRVVAYHEAGHALVALLSPLADPLNRVSIVPRGQALGVTLQVPADDRHNYSQSYLLTRVAVALGGRVAEVLVFGEPTSGAENDLELASAIIRQMVSRWGMAAGLPELTFLDRESIEFPGAGVGQQPISEHLQRDIDQAVADIANERHDFVHEMLANHREELDKLAELLLEHESVDAATIVDLLHLAGQPGLAPSALVGAV